MSVINTGSFPKALFEGVKVFYGMGYNQLPLQYPGIFDVKSSEHQFEEYVSTKPFGMAPEKQEGADLVYDTHSQNWVTRFQNLTYGLGFRVTMEEMEDNRYAQLAADRAKALGNSMRFTQETIASLVLNRAFSSSYVGGDGVELSSSLHLLGGGGTWANEPSVAADLSEVALENACTAIRGFTDDRGNKIGIEPARLIVPLQLNYEAKRILGGDMQYDTANNNINAMKALGDLPGGYVTWRYLSNPKAWFIKTTADNGLVFFDRKAPQMENNSHFNSKDFLTSCVMRFSCGWGDARGVYCSEGTS